MKVRASIGLLGIGAALAAAQPASAQLFINDPGFAKGPIEGSDPAVGLPLSGATDREYRAHLVWNLRAGLNVAALQCQFSKYLRAVDNYNGILAHHAKELADTYTVLNGYFRKAKGGAGAGQKGFDDYTTSTYNNFSTLQAQYGFCQTAADIAKEALMQPKGQLHALAAQRMRELRSSLVPVPRRLVEFTPQLIALPAMPSFDERCYDKRGRFRDRCAQPGS